MSSKCQLHTINNSTHSPIINGGVKWKKLKSKLRNFLKNKNGKKLKLKIGTLPPLEVEVEV